MQSIIVYYYYYAGAEWDDLLLMVTTGEKINLAGIPLTTLFMLNEDRRGKNMADSKKN